MLERLFKLKQKGTNVKTEVVAGFTTFITLAYIIVVNPLILSETGIPKGAAIAATILATVFATTIMALWANFPIAVAPGMGLNAFFTYTVVKTMGLSWQTALGAVFFSGVFFLLITITGIRRKIVDGVPKTLRSAIGVGIGLFIAFLGFKDAGIIVANPSTFVGLGNIKSPEVLIALLGIIIAGLLMSKQIKGALLISIVTSTVLGMIFVPQAPVPRGITDIVSLHVPSVAPTFLKLDIAGAWKYGIFSIIFSFTIVELFDNIGTLIGVTKKAGLADQDGNIENIDRALTADAIGTLASSVLGTCTVTSYIESGSGVAEGGKTGLTALTVSALFLLALFFTPLVSLIQGFATAPALIIVGVLMMGEVININFNDITEAIPAFLTIIMMPLTFSIAQGLSFGFLSFVFMKIITGRHREISPIMYIVAAAFIVNYVIAH